MTTDEDLPVEARTRARLLSADANADRREDAKVLERLADALEAAERERDNAERQLDIRRNDSIAARIARQNVRAVEEWARANDERDAALATLAKVREYVEGQARDIRTRYGHTGPAGYLGHANACEDVLAILDADAPAPSEPKRVLLTHPSDGHGPNDTCIDCEDGEPSKVPSSVAPAAEENALIEVVAAWLSKFMPTPYVPFSDRLGLARTILAAGFRRRKHVEVEPVAYEVQAGGEIPYPFLIYAKGVPNYEEFERVPLYRRPAPIDRAALARAIADARADDDYDLGEFIGDLPLADAVIKHLEGSTDA